MRHLPIGPPWPYRGPRRLRPAPLPARSCRVYFNLAERALHMCAPSLLYLAPPTRPFCTHCAVGWGGVRRVVVWWYGGVVRSCRLAALLVVVVLALVVVVAPKSL